MSAPNPDSGVFAVTSLPPFLTVAQTAELAGTSKDTIRRMVARGEIDAVKFGRLLRIRTDSFLKAGRPIRAWTAS